MRSCWVTWSVQFSGHQGGPPSAHLLPRLGKLSTHGVSSWLLQAFQPPRTPVPLLGGPSPRSALPPWPLPLGTGGVGGWCPELSGARPGWYWMRRGSACKRPECPSQQLEPCSGLWPGGLATPQAHSSWLPASRSRGLWSCLAPVLQGVYFPQAPPRDCLSLPPSGPALVGAAGGLSGTPGQRGACVARRREGRQVHLSACLLGLHPGHLVHDPCVAASPSRRGSQAARAQPAWPGPRRRVVLSQGPFCPVLRGPGPRDEQSVGGRGHRGLMARAMLVGCRGGDK